MDRSALRAVGWARSLPLECTVKTARDWARHHLDTLGWATSAPDTVDAVLLTVSELVTNAHRHAHSDAQLVMTWDSRCLHIAVHDASAELPAPATPAPTAPGDGACSSSTRWPTAGRRTRARTARPSRPVSARSTRVPDRQTPRAAVRPPPEPDRADSPRRERSAQTAVRPPS